MLEESKENEISQLQERIESKEKQLEKKEETIREIRQKLSEGEKEKSEELDKVRTEQCSNEIEKSVANGHDKP